jgi:hypothetical protein
MMTQPVQPQPSPLTPALGVANLPDGRSVVFLQIHTVLGPLHFFLAPEEADQLAAIITDAARQARTGLIVPGTSSAKQAAEQWQAATNAAIRGQG